MNKFIANFMIFLNSLISLEFHEFNAEVTVSYASYPFLYWLIFIFFFMLIYAGRHQRAQERVTAWGVAS